MNCFLDNQIAIDSVVFESGNNAEIPVELRLCKEHLNELEATEYKFEQKYSEEILQKAYERLGFI